MFAIKYDVDVHEIIVEMQWFGARLTCNNIYCDYVEEDVSTEDIQAVIESHEEYHGDS